MNDFLKIFGVIVALDALIIMGLPLTLIKLRRPVSALVAAIAISAAVIVDYNWNSPEFNAAGVGLVGLIGLPAQVMPLSIALMLSTLAMCGWAVTRDT